MFEVLVSVVEVVAAEGAKAERLTLVAGLLVMYLGGGYTICISGR